MLDPANGIFHVAANAELPRRASARIPGLTAPVSVVYDDRAVPHVFAATERDAVRALGYVVARDRLFQLEMQSRAGEGTLTELVGRAALAEDERTRALGLPAAAEVKFARLTASASADSADRSTAATLQAFADGVNAFRDALAPRDYPFEYKILRVAPRRWEPVNSIHLFARMSNTLSYNDEEAARLAAAHRVGRAAADALFPVDQPLQEPIQPSGRVTEPRAIFRPLPPPGRPDTSLFAFAPRPSPFVPFMQGDAVVGSNNWAVAAKRAQGGHAILAGDPHLGLTLPSIWYEAHLVVPGALDVYGVTIPGAPSIIIGFNRDAAWSFTNAQTDVVDRYAETLDDPVHPTRYRLDGQWHLLHPRVERYRDPRGHLLKVDTVYYTHRGPMTKVAGSWVSMRWVALDSAFGASGFAAVQHATSVRDFMARMAGYRDPAQNMLVADRTGSIGIRTTGAFPVRPGDGRGDEIRDGSTSKSDWKGWVPLARYPQAVDPAQGYLASNNQQPVDPADFAGYLGSAWIAPWRALRINELLRADSRVTPDDMRRFQTDPRSARADLFAPAFLAAAQSHRGDPDVAEGARYLAQWDHGYAPDDQRAILFEYAMQELPARLFDELRYPDEDPKSRRIRYPDEGVIAELLQQPRSPWWDDRATKEVETRDDILAAALGAAYRRAMHVLGPPDEGGWRWGRNYSANIYHLLHVPALSALHVPSQGGPGTLNPVTPSGEFGSSWRMVVELGDDVRAWGTYPGGQSGNPASSRYLSHLVTWSKGELDTLRYPRSARDLDAKLVTSELTLTPATP